jgi:hypothetical protein
MGSLARYLANGLDIRLNQQVSEIGTKGGTWQLITSGGHNWQGHRLVLTPPVPRSLALLQAGSVSLPESTLKALDHISYELCIAALVQLDGPSQVPEPGGMWPVGEPLAWVADNYRKGISATPGAITLHAGPEFSHTYWEATDDEIVRRLVEAAQPWLGPTVKRSHVRRWRYSKPMWTYPQPALYCPEPAPLIFAGDAFAGPRVEGAALSGMAAARVLLT